MARSMAEIAELLKNTEFKRQLIGGVDEDDVWKKLKRLQIEYAELIEAERQQNIGIVNQWKKTASAMQNEVEKRDALIKQLNSELEQYQPKQSKQHRTAVPIKTARRMVEDKS